MNLTVESSRTFSPLTLSIIRPKGIVIAFWAVTVLLCLQMGFTAYAQLTLPQVAEAFTRLGFPDYFRMELTWAKLLGRGTTARAGAVAAQGMGVRRLRFHPRFSADRAPRGGRWPRGVGLFRRHRRALGALVLLVAAPGDHAGAGARE